MSDRLTNDYYCDAGLVAASPSPYAGVAAWCEIGPEDTLIRSGCLIMPCPSLVKPIETNIMEFAAALSALEATPPGWQGALYTDSKNTIGRLTRNWSTIGIPDSYLDRAMILKQRLGPLNIRYVKGHPTGAELQAGLTRSGYRVSRHNVWCDQECQRLADLYLTSLPVWSSILTVGAEGTIAKVISLGPKPLGWDCGYVCADCLIAVSTFPGQVCPSCQHQATYAVPVTVYHRLAEWAARMRPPAEATV